MGEVMGPRISPQTLAEISITSKAQYAMFSRSLFFFVESQSIMPFKSPREHHGI